MQCCQEVSCHISDKGPTGVNRGEVEYLATPGSKAITQGGKGWEGCREIGINHDLPIKSEWIMSLSCFCSVRSPDSEIGGVPAIDFQLCFILLNNSKVW